jgi:endogenous inhibitor of DNA gyrase (YacG/DUF329 family)
VRCPTCSKEIEEPIKELSPFCSSRCRLSDLGGWLDGRYRIADRESPQDEGT